MSILFHIGFIRIPCGEVPKDDFTTEVLIAWALFYIAEAIWNRRI